jgi:hypothetical protein
MNRCKNKLFVIALMISAMAFGTQSCSDEEAKLNSTSTDVGGLLLSIDKATLLLNETVALEAQVFPAEAIEKSVKWKSDNQSAASVDGNGLVTALSEGTANVTVTAVGNEGLVRTCAVTVLKTFEFNISATSLLINMGTVHTLEVEILPASVLQDVTWSSSNLSVASVDGNGAVTAVSIGTATITATSVRDPDRKVECDVTVVVSRTGWTAESRGGNHPWGEYGGQPECVLDGNILSGWHSNVGASLPQCLVIDMKKSLQVSGVHIAHLPGAVANNWIYFNTIEIYLTETAVTPDEYQPSWGEPAATYTWTGGIDPFTITLSAVTEGRYMILYFPDSRTATYISFAELNVYTME